MQNVYRTEMLRYFLLKIRESGQGEEKLLKYKRDLCLVKTPRTTAAKRGSEV